MTTASSIALGLVYRWTDHTLNPTGEARAILRRALKHLGLPDDTISDGVLAASELVANAREHARGPYEMHLRMIAGRYICEIHDGDLTLPTNLHFAAVPLLPATSEGCPGGLDSPCGPLAERGRGLYLVHELTKGQWGFHFTEHGTKAAWVVLAAVPGVLHRSNSDCNCDHARASEHGEDDRPARLGVWVESDRGEDSIP